MVSKGKIFIKIENFDELHEINKRNKTNMVVNQFPSVFVYKIDELKNEVRVLYSKQDIPNAPKKDRWSFDKKLTYYETYEKGMSVKDFMNIKELYPEFFV